MQHLVKTSYLKAGLLLVLVGLLTNCKQSATSDIDYATLPTYSNFKENVLNAVIEIPAGTSKKYEYQSSNNRFVLDKKEGKDRVVNYLPYPGNYGYIPATFLDPKKGGDGDAVDILVLCEHLPQGTVVEVKPIAIFHMNDNDERDSKVIAVPVDPALRSFKVDNFKTLNNDFLKAKIAIEYWFTNYEGSGDSITEIHWQDETAAYREINKWLVEKIGSNNN